MSKKLLIFLIAITTILVIIVYSIFNSKTKGYTEIEDNVFIKYIVKSELVDSLSSGDYARVSIKYTDKDDSVFYANITDIQMQGSNSNSLISTVLKKVFVGDSVSLLIKASDFFEKYIQQPKPNSINNSEFIKIDFRIISSMSEQEYNNSMSTFYGWVDSPRDYELSAINDYIKTNNYNFKEIESGIFYSVLEKGNGNKPSYGSSVLLEFEGKTLNGKVFDSTKERKQLFSYNYGGQMQIIKGLEESVKLMTENEKAIVIIPSWLAFGELGSATGIIPPYTSVIYEVEIKKID